MMFDENLIEKNVTVENHLKFL